MCLYEQCSCYISGIFPAAVCPFIGWFVVTWHAAMKLFTAECHEWVTLLLLHMIWYSRWNLSMSFQICFFFFHPFWSLQEQWILFPSNLNVPLDFVSGNIETLRKTKFTVPWPDQSLSVNYYCPVNLSFILNFQSSSIVIFYWLISLSSYVTIQNPYLTSLKN